VVETRCVGDGEAIISREQIEKIVHGRRVAAPDVHEELERQGA
jgi:hypothetical protein